MTDNLPARCRVRLFYFSLATLLSGFVSVESFVEPVLENREFKMWQRVPCEIKVSEVRPWGAPRDLRNVPAVRYEYSYEGKHYESTGFAWSYNLKPVSRKKVLKMLAPYVAGAPAECFLHHENPGRAFLLRPRMTGFLPIWMGALAVILTVVFAWKLLMEWKRKPLPM